MERYLGESSEFTNGRYIGAPPSLQKLPNNSEGAAPLPTNDALFAVDPTFKTGATDFSDDTDPSVLGDSVVTTDTHTYVT